MGKIGQVSEFPRSGDLEEVKKYLADFAKDTVQQVNGNLNFFDNIKCNIIDVTFSTANVDVPIRHTLGKTPTGYWLVKTNVAAILYTGSTPATPEFITLKSSVAATTKIFLF